MEYEIDISGPFKFKVPISSVRLVQVPNPPQNLDMGGYRPEMPAYQGFLSLGGRGDSGSTPAIIKVNTLADNNSPLTNLGNNIYSGTLRAALTFNGPRFVVFEVSGYINLNSSIRILNPYLTVAGQTAPAPGICVRVNPSITFGNAISIGVQTHDTVWQHIRIRPGINCNSALEFFPPGNSPGTNIFNHIVDHCSISWFQDEGILAFRQTNRVVVWKSIIAEALHSLPGSEICSGGGRDNGHCILFERGQNNYVIQSLLANNFYRNPQVKGGSSTYVANNLIYGCNLGPFYADTDGNGPLIADCIGNHFKRNNESFSEVRAIGTRYLVTGSKLYLADNIFENSSTSPNWTEFQVIGPDGIDPRVNQETGVAPVGYVRLLSGGVYNRVLTSSGARSKFRDDGVDDRIVQNVKDGVGSCLNQSIPGGYPVLAQNINTFQIPSNPFQVVDSVGRTRLEEYLESLARSVEA